MRNKKAKFGVLAIIGMASALLSSACGKSNDSYDPASNATPTLYGNPISASDDFDPSRNENYEVYGPAPEEIDPSYNDYIDEKEPSDFSSDSTFSWREDTSGNLSAHDISSNLKEAVSGSDGEFNPSTNIAEPVYGPPAGEKSATE